MSARTPTPEQLAGVIRGLDNAFQYCDSTQAFDSSRHIREAAAAIGLLSTHLLSVERERDALLEALKSAEHHVRNQWIHWNYAGNKAMAEQAERSLKKIRTALAKARGEVAL